MGREGLVPVGWERFWEAIVYVCGMGGIRVGYWYRGIGAGKWSPRLLFVNVNVDFPRADRSDSFHGFGIAPRERAPPPPSFIS